MKDKIHPQVFSVKIICACGHAIETVSTSQSVSIAVCSNCHPFYTGKQKLVDTAGRVDRFNKRYGKPSAAAAEAKKS